MNDSSHRILVMSYDARTRDLLRWAVGEFAAQVYVASSWTLAMSLAGQHRPTIAVLDFDNVSPQGRTYLAKLLPARHRIDIIVVGGVGSLDDAVRHGIRYGVEKPIDVQSLMVQVEVALRRSG
jgi:DNA-binding response OmpR family regulator